MAEHFSIPYSLELPPSDCYPFSNLKRHSFSKPFTNRDDIEETLNAFFTAQPATLRGQMHQRLTVIQGLWYTTGDELWRQCSAGSYELRTGRRRLLITSTYSFYSQAVDVQALR